MTFGWWICDFMNCQIGMIHRVKLTVAIVPFEGRWLDFGATWKHAPTWRGGDVETCQSSAKDQEAAWCGLMWCCDVSVLFALELRGTRVIGTWWNILWSWDLDEANEGIDDSDDDNDHDVDEEDEDKEEAEDNDTVLKFTIALGLGGLFYCIATDERATRSLGLRTSPSWTEEYHFVANFEISIWYQY